MIKRIALIGLGPHARRIYYPYLEEMLKNDPEAKFEVLIDLAINKNRIKKFLSERKIKPNHIVYLDTKNQINPMTINPTATEALRTYKINKAIISTEPKAHKIYLEECIRLNIDAVTDKPITAPIGVVNSLEAADEIYNNAFELAKKIDGAKSRILVQCQRRNHTGYGRVFDIITSLVKEYNIPITFISIHHSDGMWNMPDEFIYRENHPYKYGYGKLMHSGYHFIDLLIKLFQVSSLAEGKTPDSVEIFSQYSRVTDQHCVINNDDYAKFFNKDVAKKFSNDMKEEILADFGEVDSYSQIQLSKNKKILTTVQMSLIQSGFSQRAWSELPEDAYKSNGRIRHEYINIHIGPLASIQIHSYQSKQINEQSLAMYDVGGNSHFDIYIFRNSNLIGGKAFEKIQYGAEDLEKHKSNSYLGHNEYARHATLNELMYDKPSNSELKSHLATNKLLSEIYKNHARQTSGKIPYSKFNAKEII